MKDFEDVLLDVVLRNGDDERARLKDIETKTFEVITLIITISGIVSTLLTKPTNSGTMLGVLFVSINVFLLISILFCLRIIFKRAYLAVLSPKLLIEDLKNESLEHQIRSIIATIISETEGFRILANNKAKELQYAIFSFAFSIILMILYSLWTFL